MQKCTLYFENVNRPPDKCVLENYFLYSSSKTYVVGTQKNRLNEKVLLSTQNICLNRWAKKIITILRSKNLLIWIYVLILKKVSIRQQKYEKLPSMQRVEQIVSIVQMMTVLNHITPKLAKTLNFGSFWVK